VKVKAAVAFTPDKPLEIAMVDLDGPKAGEVLVEIKATGVCHTDEFTRSGADPEGLFPEGVRPHAPGRVDPVGGRLLSAAAGVRS
jgi:S-(hydroxymethyl)glutathione dehydrogenase/alcohol dehydrogenase